MPAIDKVKRTWTVHDKNGPGPIFQLDSAIMIYRYHQRGWEPSTSDFNDQAVYATIHRIERNRRGGPFLAAGRPATLEGCTQFVKALSDRAEFSGLISPNMLYVGRRVVAWWRPAAPARVWFKAEEGPQRERDHMAVGTRSAVTPHPGIVFALADGTWHVFAVAGDERPGADTPLFQAPYFNVYGNGAICEGNIERPAKVTPETIARFERAFFDSRFTHPNERKLVNFRGGAGALWKDLLDGRWKTFPRNVLRPLRKTLVETLREMEGGKHARH